MRKEFGQLEGNTHITDDLALYGLCTGDIVMKTATAMPTNSHPSRAISGCG